MLATRTRMNVRAHLARCIVMALLLLAARAQAQDYPLPDPAAFLPEVKKLLQTDQTLQSSYSFVETRRERKLDGGGRATSESVAVGWESPLLTTVMAGLCPGHPIVTLVKSALRNCGTALLGARDFARA